MAGKFSDAGNGRQRKLAITASSDDYMAIRRLAKNAILANCIDDPAASCRIAADLPNRRL